ncbi:TonB-dependent receptor [Psychrobium sp. 1_MG-2023]|uniref:TonB-dependent receptor n=1 Tax=Psychrobium sp. 1_MG-2023 TaxID=3062624 RepID=UPI000C328FEC|nr:TonB-dependent receptor [Psychrobium sp. 1_MG-2023]MDP2560042.1 TonB-dependent receptor [Psychrobium sp. 1_MG-2023]PKF56296.1 TonB-dependent receptor [Alteromonadales bacterium alter-6D02]
MNKQASVSSQTNGHLKKSIIALSISTAIIAPASFAATNDKEKNLKDVEVIDVRGIRASTTKNLNTKRFADSVVDSISAEDIGKLPDVTIADSLQRVPGIQIRRSAGEGSTINVRGMPQVTTLLNGEQFLSAGSLTTVQPDFTDIPSALVGGMDVIKSSNASTLAGGISGTINLKTRRPLDLDEGTTLLGSTEFTQGSYSDETDNKTMAFAGYNGGDIGVIVTVSKDKSNLANYRLGSTNHDWGMAPFEGGTCWYCPSQPLNNDGDDDDAEFTYVSYGNVNRFTERERLGANLTLQAQLTDSLEFVGDVFYTDMDDADRQQGLMADNAWGGHWAWQDQHDPINRGLTPGGKNFYTAQDITLNAPRVVAHSESHTNKRESTNINLELNYQGDGPLSGSFRYINGSADRSHTENVAQGYMTNGLAHGLQRNDGDGARPVNPDGYGPGTIPVGLDYTGSHPTLSVPSIDGEVFGSNINRYALSSTYSENNFDEEAALDIVRLDGKYEFDTEHLKAVNFGVRFGDREVTRQEYVLLAPIASPDGSESIDIMWKDQGLALYDTDGSGGAPSSTAGDLTVGAGNLIRYSELPKGWVQQTSDFGPVSPGTFYFIDPRKLDDPFAFQNTFYPGNKRAATPGTSFKVSETTQNLFVQADLGNDNYSANVGFQYIKTELDIVQNLVGDPVCQACPGKVAEDLGDVVTKKEYSDFLPSFNLSTNLTEDLIFRAAWGKTMTRLDLADVAGGLSISRSRAGDELAAREGISPDLLIATNAQMQGNPDLQPWRATNTDLSLEWYYSPSALVSIGLFNVQLESFIESSSWTAELPDADGVVRREVAVTGLDNAPGGTISGAEFAYQQAFDFLPDMWSGLGAGFNYTYSDSESGRVDFNGEQLPLQDNSKHSANAVLWYEKDGLQLRLATNYRSKRLASLSGVGGLEPNGLAIWTEPTTYVDISASYDINENVSVYLSGSNLTEEYEVNYAQWSDNQISQNVYERRMTIGIRGRL